MIRRMILVAPLVWMASGFAQPILAADASKPKVAAADALRAVEAAGYTDVRSLDLEKDKWEIEATSPAGQKVELKVDANSGAIVSEKRD